MDRKSPTPWTRRQFLATSLTTLAGAGLAPGRLLARPNGAGLGQGRSVAVIGAGLAGLAAALELVEAGCEVVVLEARSRPGGRVHTLHEGFAPGIYAEAGGEIIGDNYELFRHYAERMGLALQPTPPVNRKLDFLVEIGGKRLRWAESRKDPSFLPAGLSEEEAELAPFALLLRALARLAAEMGSPERALDAAFARYDALSLAELLREEGVSEAAIGLIDRPLNYNSVDTVSALSVLRDFARRQSPVSGLRLEGGNGRLIAALARQLGDRIRYSAALRRIDRPRQGRQVERGAPMRLTVESHGYRSEVEAEAVIVTLPATALREIEFVPALPPDPARAIAELPYTQITKTFVQTRSRILGEKNLRGVWSDGPHERIFDLSSGLPGPRGLLVSWINGEGTRFFDAMSDEEQNRHVLERIGDLFPDRRDTLETVRTINWNRDPWVRGAYAHYAPGQLRAFAPLLGRPIGDLHFAGEHTELAAPGMEGALRSGLRAAREVLGLEESPR